MEPTYATYDPLQLTYLENGLVTDRREMHDPIAQNIPIPPRGGGAVRAFGAYGQMETGEYPEVYAPEMTTMQQDSGWGSGLLDSIGGALSNIIRTVGQQAPGIITGQPTYQPGTYPYGYPTASPLGGISPILLIGGIVVVGYLLMRKR